MSKVIWKGNGIGIVIGTNGIHIIGPCDPLLLAKFQAIAAIQAAHRGLPPEIQHEAAALSTKLARNAVADAQKLVGEPLDAEGGVVFYDADDGFICGSTGKPPIPLPHPRTISLPATAVVG
ncbi:hypothetical protein SAMN05216486_10110 [bacterium JGI 053]|nr:hypothetical protein SAMN05216486_10110 [bacterium JGI 053]